MFSNSKSLGFQNKCPFVLGRMKETCDGPFIFLGYWCVRLSFEFLF